MEPETARAEPAISVRDLSFAWSGTTGTPLFEHLSFQVSVGHVLAIVGTSGSGKSTLLRILAGLIQPLGGEVRVLGAKPNPTENAVGMLFQQDKLVPWMSVRENILLGTLSDTTDRAQRTLTTLVPLLRLEDRLEYFPKHLSGGMRERTAIARTLMTQPTVLLLDEALRSTDYTHRLEIEDFVQSVVRNSFGAAVTVTHDLEQAVAIGDEILALGHHQSGTAAVHSRLPDALRKLRGSERRTSALFASALNALIATMRAVPPR